MVVAVGNDSTTLETLRFELAKIEAATNRFAKENMIGKGGFGEVYRVNILATTILKENMRISIVIYLFTMLIVNLYMFFRVFFQMEKK